MQNEIIIKEKKVSRLSIDTKREIAKIGMTASLGIVTATAFCTKNSFMKNLHIVSGAALIGFCVWHHFLYPNKANKRKKQKNED